MGVITVAVNVLLLAVFALSAKGLWFLQEYISPISIVLWACLIWGFWNLSKNETDPKEKLQLIAVPFSGIPAYCFLLTSISDIFLMGGFEMFLAILLELPLCLMVSILFGIGSNVVAGKLDTELVIPVSLLLNILSAVFLCSLGI